MCVLKVKVGSGTILMQVEVSKKHVAYNFSRQTRKKSKTGTNFQVLTARAG